MVEKDTQMVFDLAARIYFLEQGRVALEGPSTDIASNAYVKEIYLGMTYGEDTCAILVYLSRSR